MSGPTSGPVPGPGHGPTPALGSVLVVGTGLVGTSVGLALRAAGVQVYLQDRQPGRAATAAALGAGQTGPPREPVDLAVLAVPPQELAAAYVGLVRPERTRPGPAGPGPAWAYTDVTSVKAAPVRALRATGLPLDRFAGGHPLAGGERSGPGAARADLFRGRPWVLTPLPETEPAVLARVEELARRCGAVPVVLDPEEHDAAVALVSHAPHLVASLVAARLAEAAPDQVALAGPGITDVTRVAAADPRLWLEILTANAAAVAAVLRPLRDDLAAALACLEGLAAAAQGRSGPADPPVEAADRLLGLLARGREGRRRLPGKHGAAAAAYAAVPVVVEDRPGELARLLVAAGETGVNIEDVTIEHAPGAPLGLVELAVRPELADRLAADLARAGWSVQPGAVPGAPEAPEPAEPAESRRPG